jgi:hypothetical protein
MVLAVAMALGCSASGFAALSKEEREAEDERITAEHKSAKEQCDTLKANAKDVCRAEADGAYKVARANLDARDKGSMKAQLEARLARAEAAYAVAKERCDDLAGNVKHVCLLDAKAALARGKALAKLEREDAAFRDTARADPRAAREHCDRYAGDTKDGCLSDAKVVFK